MKKILFLSMLLWQIVLPLMAIDMKVGDTKTLNIGNVSNLQGCQWAISRPNDVVFTSTPQSYSTQVTIKAVNAFPATSPCVVQCKYYYLDLDPTTGRYIYLRTGYKDWTIFVSNNGTGSNPDNPASNTIILNRTEATIHVGEWVLISASSSQKLSWSIDVPLASGISTNNKEMSIRGICPGETYIRVRSDNGGYASCKLTVLPKDSYEVGEDIEARTIEGTEIHFKITDTQKKTCEVTGIANPTSEVTVPLEAHGFLVTAIGSFYSYRSYIKYNIRKINLPSSIESIGSGAFKGYESLEDINLPESLEEIKNGTFNQCRSLKSIHLPQSLREIGDQAFRYCESLEEISIPPSVTSIGEHAFSLCNNLISITIPKSVTSIGEATFYGCTSLKKISIPSSVTSIGNSAFSHCESLKEASIPLSVEYLGEYAFSGCLDLTSVIIPASVKKINTYTFYNCGSLKDVYCYPESVPETESDAFGNSSISSATLHVPLKTLENYKETVPWNHFGKIVALTDEEMGIKDFTLMVATKYITFYNSQSAYILPTGLTASVVTGVNNGKLTYQIIAEGGKSNNVIPKGVAVMLTNKKEETSSYTLKPTDNEATYSNTNWLKGSDETTTTTADGNCLFYKLSYGPSNTNQSDVFGWYWGAANGNAFQIEGNKAWLAVPMSAGAPVRSFTIEDEATNIESLEKSTKTDDKYYNLQGRRISKPTSKGIYIYQGKKYIIK